MSRRYLFLSKIRYTLENLFSLAGVQSPLGYYQSSPRNFRKFSFPLSTTKHAWRPWTKIPYKRWNSSRLKSALDPLAEISPHALVTRVVHWCSSMLMAKPNKLELSPGVATLVVPLVIPRSTLGSRRMLTGSSTNLTPLGIFKLKRIFQNVEEIKLNAITLV